MKNLSVVILTKNSENLIADCIDSVSFCDEVIVIDDYSTDRTTELARHLGAVVFPYSSESFAKKRNLGLKKAKGRWILYLDVDERVSPELTEAIKEFLKEKVTSMLHIEFIEKIFILAIMNGRLWRNWNGFLKSQS